MRALTKRQRELLEYLRSCDDCPSFVEMRDALGFASKSAIHRLLSGLEERGYITRLHNRARAIYLVPGMQPPPISRPMRAVHQCPEIVWIPLHGRIS
jgi:repressor LexA